MRYLIIIGYLIFSQILYSQCNDGFTYYTDAEIPSNVQSFGSNCFYNDDIAVLNNLISLNGLSYESALDAGQQTWNQDRLTIWVATYVPNGANGLTEKIDQLPENIGQLNNLTTLYLEWHNLTQLPESFSNLTNLVNLAISNNWLDSIPINIGNLENLFFLDLGYNQLTSLPESIGYLINLEYLYLFNNQLTTLPESICMLNLDWDGIDLANYPYFASGGNYLCCSNLIPDCVEESNNLNICLDQFYYNFILDEPQICPDLGNINGDVDNVGQPVWNVLDIVMLANCVLAQNCDELPNSCAGDMNGDGGWNVLDIVTLANCVLAGTCGG